MRETIQIHLTAGFSPQPARNFMQLWGLDPDKAGDVKTMNNWCLLKKVPGAFHGPDGAWWVNPILMLRWGEGDGITERKRLHREEEKET